MSNYTIFIIIIYPSFVLSCLFLYLVFVSLPWYLSIPLFISDGVLMKFRKKLSRSNSRKSFTRGATRIHRKNTNPNPMRGGIRL